MSKIFVVMGKSASGKDTIFKQLKNKEELKLKTVILYTTRPIREGETNGVEYYFVDDKKLQELKENNKIIEHRSYQTVHGVWHYFTAHDGQINLEKDNYIMIGTIETYNQIKKYFGEDKVIPVYIHVDDGIRLERALRREKVQRVPKYAEMCRRFLADEEDFSNKNLKDANITKAFANANMRTCMKEITEYMESMIQNI